MTKKKPPTPLGKTRFEVSDGQGGWREATKKELILASIRFDWAAMGQVPPPEMMARVAALYDEALDEALDEDDDRGEEGAKEEAKQDAEKTRPSAISAPPMVT